MVTKLKVSGDEGAGDLSKKLSATARAQDDRASSFCNIGSPPTLT
jgi:hypothetical protein